MWFLQQLEFVVPSAPAVSYDAIGDNAPVSGGLTATLSGMAFTSSDLTPTATVASVDCATSSWVSGTTVECLMSATATAISTNVVVTVAAVSGTLISTFSFDGMVCVHFLMTFLPCEWSPKDPPPTAVSICPCSPLFPFLLAHLLLSFSPPSPHSLARSLFIFGFR